MKKKILTVLIAFIALFAHAQTRSYEGEITLIPVRLEQHGEMLHVDMNIVLKEVKVKSAHGIDIIPHITTGQQTKTLPKVSLKGRSEYMDYERGLALMSSKEKARYKQPYLVEKDYKRKGDTIQYRYVLPYETWMADAKLDVQRDDCGCGEVNNMMVENVIDRVALEKIPMPYTIVPHMTFVQPAAEAIKNRDVQTEAFLDFAVNRTEIRAEYMNNPRELNKIHAMIDGLKTDSDVKVHSLDIIGYASPEGSLAANKRLSEGRAMALRNYLMKQYDFARNSYNIVFGGENWEGLLKALPSVEMQYKDEVQEIIAKYEIENNREKRLMDLRGGQPYRFLLKNVFPSLRVAICRVNYSVKNFDIDEAKEVIKQRPQNLSLNEMFLVANTYPVGSQEFIDVFETAVRIFPENETANLNAAASALLRNDMVSAKRYLNRVRPATYPAEYNNTMGMLALLKGDYDRAEKHLNDAANAGLETAKLNLNELNAKKQNNLELKKYEQINN